MQEVDYISLKTKCLFIFPVIILFSTFSCKPDTLWDIPVTTVKEKLKSSNYTFIDTIDFNHNKPMDVRVLGPGAYFYFSSIFSSLEQPKEESPSGPDPGNLPMNPQNNSHKNTDYSVFSREMLLASWYHEKKIWKDEAGFRYLGELLKEKEYKLLEAYAFQYIKKIKNSINLTDVKKLYIEALYWQQKDEAVLYSISKFFPDTIDLAEEHPELFLFKAVAECRFRLQGWENTFTEFLIHTESSALHYRAYQFIMLEQERFSALHETIQQLLIAKSFLGSGYLSPAIPIFEMFLEKCDPSLIENSGLINELGHVYLSQEEYSRGITFLEKLATKFKSKGNMDALEMAGRLARKDDKDKKAAHFLKSVFTKTSDPLQRDRTAWFYLDCILEISSIHFIREIISYASQWEDPGYFDDIIQKGMSILIAEKNWNHLQAFFRDIETFVSPEILTQIHYLTARLLTLGYFKGNSTSVENEIKTYLMLASEEKKYSYYGLLASALLKKLPSYLQAVKETVQEKNKGNNKKNQALITGEDTHLILSPADEFIRGFFEYGLMEEGYTQLIKYNEEINNTTIFKAVKNLQEHDYYKKSIWLMNRLMSRKEYQLSTDELMHAYPRAFDQIITENAKKRDFFIPFFYALIREESAFDIINSSRAGAVGLSQLMPATAADIAEWLRLKEYDLLDPETNILMGAYYYSRLLRLLDSIPKTLIAYNAGLGRLRQWEKEYTGLPPDLFIEALPYKETRLYIRKIAVTACMYSFIYDNKEPAEVISLFFPHMF